MEKSPADLRAKLPLIHRTNASAAATFYFQQRYTHWWFLDAVDASL